MNAANHSTATHSAIVRMQLTINGRVLPIAQLGPNFIILRNPIDHAPADGEIAMWIDGHETDWCICLPDGIRAGQLETAIAKTPDRK